MLNVKVVPGASRTRYMGEWQGHAKIAVAAPAEKGKANAALLSFLADLLAIRKNALSVQSRQTSPRKTIRIDGVSLEAVRRALKPDRS